MMRYQGWPVNELNYPGKHIEKTKRFLSDFGHRIRQ